MEKQICLFIVFIFLGLNMEAQCPYIAIKEYQQINGKDTVIQRNDFSFFNELEYEIKGHQYSGIFMTGLRMAGLTPNEELLYSEVTYYGIGKDSDYATGPLDDKTGETNDQNCYNWNQFFVIKKEDIENFKLDFVDNCTIDNPIPDAIKYYPCNGNQLFSLGNGFELPQENKGGLAPFFDRNNDGIYNCLEGDYPIIEGQEQSFYIANDLSVYSETPIKMEFLVRSSYDTPSVDKVLSSKVKLRGIYHGEENLHGFYFNFWMDGDLKCHENNAYGCLPDENIFFYYMNEDWNDDCPDSLINEPFPLLIVKMEEGNQAKMSSFIGPFIHSWKDFIPAIIGPDSPEEQYNYMQGRWRDGTKLTGHGNGYDKEATDYHPYLYDHSGNAPSGVWRLCDKNEPSRDLQSYTNFGPYELTKGDMVDLSMTIYLIKDSGITCPTAEDIKEIYTQVSAGMYEENTDNSFAQFNLYPIPSKDQLTIQLCEALEFDVEIYSFSGKKVLHQSFERYDAKNIDIRDLAPAVYVLRIMDKDKILYTQKIVKS